MIGAVLRAGLDRFERRWNYDAGYMRRILAADRRAGLKLALATGFMNHDFGLPAEVAFAARLRSTRAADCGPCLRLGLAMAAAAGVPAALLRPALQDGAPPPDDRSDIALAIGYTDAVLAGSADAPGFAAEAAARFGPRGQAGLAVAVLAGQTFPLLKRGMGEAASCAPVLRELAAMEDADA
ncbi:hypothetical protein ACFOGJ_25510 [Marinibaculum pumilum]|uniref:Uncharacterized protein n=1 Tax=Marinibaculum pumilum TaxID=1766165 RepID=A0ABV7L896_9PROT